ANSVYGTYVYTSKSKPATLRAPDVPGDYELRYLTGAGNSVLARTKIKIAPATASIQAQTDAVAGSAINVKWQGPNNERDYITVVKKGSSALHGNYAYTAKGNPLVLTLPLEAGDYELRYATAQSHTTLASAAIRITPAREEPGTLVVTATAQTKPKHAVEIILDASGSMLQRLGQQRRIDIAKQTLTNLTTNVIPAGTQFAMRVFGREVDSCQTDLDIPLGPLNPTAVAARIAALEAKNGAKTPIGASLEKVAADLQSATGERLVILVTDGEETCDGNPAVTIQQLRKAGTQLRVNIVGFAVDDQKLAATFRQWSDLGGGVYFDAKDAAALSTALAAALQPAFEVVSAQSQVIAEGLVSGESVRVPAGTHSLRVKGSSTAAQSITIKPKETTNVALKGM
ncbi:MAG TPA: vWA domain-containing protein, partial [Steroidobacteraceae bacterium]|nr:vWA domain-containing protein [Steroidobacteraceae bacterium]